MPTKISEPLLTKSEITYQVYGRKSNKHTPFCFNNNATKELVIDIITSPINTIKYEQFLIIKKTTTTYFETIALKDLMN